MPAIEYATLADRDELLAFLLGVFRRQRPDHPPFEALYPDLFQDEATIGCHAVIRDAGRIVACVGAYPIPLRVAGLDIPTAGFGQVATSPDHLGRGYMTALMKAQLSRLRRRLHPRPLFSRSRGVPGPSPRPIDPHHPPHPPVISPLATSY